MNMKNKTPPVEDAGLAALVAVARFHGIAADAAQLKHAAANGTMPFTENDLVLTARRIGLKARAVDLKSDRLAGTPLPALVLDRDGRHFILAKSDGKTALVLEAGAAAPNVRTLEEIVSRSSGKMLLFTSRASLTGDLARFDFSWFIPAVIRR